MKSKIYISFLLFSFYFQYCRAQYTTQYLTTTSADYQLIGKVKEFRTSSFEAWWKLLDNGVDFEREWNESTKKQMKVEFDTLGRVISSININSSGDTVTESQTKYNSSGQVISEGSLNWLTLCRYDSLGRQTVIRTGPVKPDPHWERDSFEDSLFYDTLGRVIEVHHKEVITNFSYVEYLEYDDNGRLIKSSSEHGDKWDLELYKYNESSKIVEWLSIDHDDTTRRIAYNYVNDELVSKTIEILSPFHFQAPRKKLYFEYSGGLISKVLKYDKTGLLETTDLYSYDFDKQHNWVKILVRRNGVNERIVVREIVYY